MKRNKSVNDVPVFRRKIACRVECQDCCTIKMLPDVPCECPFCHSINLFVEKL